MLMSVKEAAVYLGVEPDTLRKWVQKKQITHYRIVGRPKFKQADLDRFIEANRVPAILRMKDFKPRSFKKAQ
jgi:excisionase family DNA binding protein